MIRLNPVLSLGQRRAIFRLMKPNLLLIVLGSICLVAFGYWLCLLHNSRKPSIKPGPVGFAMLPATPIV